MDLDRGTGDAQKTMIYILAIRTFGLCYNLKKMIKMTDEIAKYGILNVVALQKIRWKEQGELRKKAYSIYYSGSEKLGLRGIESYVEKGTRESVLSFDLINDRICKLRLKDKFQNITIISVYARTEDSEGGRERQVLR